MPLCKTLHQVSMSRNGARTIVEPGTEFDFTNTEVAEMMKMNPRPIVPPEADPPADPAPQPVVEVHEEPQPVVEAHEEPQPEQHQEG